MSTSARKRSAPSTKCSGGLTLVLPSRVGIFLGNGRKRERIAVSGMRGAAVTPTCSFSLLSLSYVCAICICNDHCAAAERTNVQTIESRENGKSPLVMSQTFCSIWLLYLLFLPKGERDFADKARARAVDASCVAVVVNSCALRRPAPHRQQ